MDRKRLVQAGYNAIAVKYLETRTADAADVQLLQALVQRLPPGATILDVGCGPGVPVTRLLSQVFTVIGVDFAEKQLRLARQLVPQARFVCQDLTTLTFPDHTFDAICAYYAIIHIPRQEHWALLRSFQRMVKPSGFALLCMGAGDLAEDIDENYLGTRMYWSHYDGQTNLKMVQACGFEVMWSQVVADRTDPGAAHLFMLGQKTA
jgi:ubiquinone/menaquinone biosynthesis C-methylase UbiE